MGSREVQETHVLLVTLPLQGHINPMLKFAKNLSSMNLHFTLATTEQARDLLSTETDTTDRLVDLAFFSDGLSKDDPRADKSLLESLRNVGDKNLSKIIGEKRFSCIISSPFTPWVPAVATAHNIPCAVLWIQACGAFSIYYRYFKKTNSFPDDLEDLNQTVELPALPLLKVRDLPSFLLPSGGSHFNKLMAEFAACLSDVKWVLVNSFYELESDIIESMCELKPMIPIGPLVSPILLGGKEETLDGENLDMWKSDDYCMEWLDKQVRSSVIYISFGSLLKPSENQVESIAMALKNIEASFLWVIRPKERAQNVLVLQKMVKEGKGVVIEWGPQERILSHLALSCFITHCGWNSTIETVAAGVPVVAYPSWTDQPVDARLLVDVFGIGVRMRNDTTDGELKVSKVERCIKAVTEGSTAANMRKRAMELKHAARLAMAPGGSSTRNLETFIDDIAITKLVP